MIVYAELSGRRRDGRVRGPVGPTCVYTDRSQVHGAATCYAKLTVCQTYLSVFVQQPVDPISAADIIHSALSRL